MNTKSLLSRQQFIEDLLSRNFTTYFAATHPAFSKGNPAYRFTASPVSPAKPYSWSYAEARARLMELGELLTADEAERRNINFVNPGLKDFMPAATLPTLRGGIQLLLPGEKAYAHRHTANAFRLVIEAPQVGAYTNVEGYKLPMSKGDLILTPNWTWHDHHNESDSNTIWYDGLDVLVAYFIGGVFFEEMVDVTGQQYQSAARSAEEITDAYGSGLLQRRKIFPDHIPESDNTLIYYPYRKARQQLADLAAAGAGNATNGVLLEYVNPVTSGPAFPTMSTSLRLVEGKSTLDAMHRTENIIFITLEGSLTFDLPDGQSFTAEANDVTAIPSWVPYSIRNSDSDPAIVFSQSDRPIFQALSFYREGPA
jgi:gentisate 1,2-dioxygenase